MSLPKPPLFLFFAFRRRHHKALATKRKMPKQKKDAEKPTPWKKSDANLAKDIIEGVITDDMDWHDVFWYRPEYALMPYSKFYE